MTNEEIALGSWEDGGFDHENFAKAVGQTMRKFFGIEGVSICVSGVKDSLSGTGF